MDDPEVLGEGERDRRCSTPNRLCPDLVRVVVLVMVKSLLGGGEREASHSRQSLLKLPPRPYLKHLPGRRRLGMFTSKNISIFRTGPERRFDLWPRYLHLQIQLNALSVYSCRKQTQPLWPKLRLHF